MKTYLELTQDLMSEVGAASGGVPASTVGQIGMPLKYLTWVAKADHIIQVMWEDWNFLWSTWELTMVENIFLYSPPDIFGTWDKTGTFLNYGTSEVSKVKYIEYLQYRDNLAASDQTPGIPTHFTSLPDNQIAVWPPPSAEAAGMKMKADYYRAPVKMTANNSTSRIPEHFQELISLRAKMMFAKYSSNEGLFAITYAEFQELMGYLKSFALPDRHTNKSRQNEQLIIRTS